jgi:SAM-dependent methyltransferase
MARGATVKSDLQCMAMPATGDCLASGSQEDFHHSGFDYLAGSPHLAQARLRLMLVDMVAGLIDRQFERTGRCRVLEVGGGHGTFTEAIAGLGATVTVTEMSTPSARYLATRFAHNDRVSVVLDRQGDLREIKDNTFDLVVYVSVLHHIPDYLSHVAALSDLIEPGGALFSAMDPIWYDRQGRITRLIDRGSYFAWRVAQGNLRQGLATRIRRARRVYENRPEDMAEYHVVRDGVDDLALVELLEAAFESVERFEHWVTHSNALRHFGRLGIVNTFGLIAIGRLQ